MRRCSCDCAAQVAEKALSPTLFLPDGSLMILPMAMVRPSSRSVKRPCRVHRGRASAPQLPQMTPHT